MSESKPRMNIVAALTEVRRLATQVLEKPPTTKESFRTETIKQFFKALLVSGILAIPPGATTAWVFGKLKSEAVSAVTDVAENLLDVQPVEEMRKELVKVEEYLNELEKMDEAEREGTGEGGISALTDRISEILNRFEDSIETGRGPLYSKEKLPILRDKLIKAIESYEQGQKEVERLQMFSTVYDYLTHWIAWYAIIMSSWMSVSLGRRIRDSKIQGEISSRELAEALVLLVDKDSTEVSNRQIQHMAGVIDSMKKLTSIMAKLLVDLTDKHKDGKGITREQLALLNDLVKASDSLGITLGDESKAALPETIRSNVEAEDLQLSKRELEINNLVDKLKLGLVSRVGELLQQEDVQGITLTEAVPGIRSFLNKKGIEVSEAEAGEILNLIIKKVKEEIGDKLPDDFEFKV